MMEKAVIDRIEEGTAVLLVGDLERELLVSADLLPDGAKGGTWLQVEFEGNRLLRAHIDLNESRRVRRRIKTKLNRLRERGRTKRGA